MRVLRTATILSLLSIFLANLPVFAGGLSQKTADMSKPVQVYILLGDANMIGFGKIWGGNGSLEHATKKKGLYPYLVDTAGKWTVRNDVRNVYLMDCCPGPVQWPINQFMTVKGHMIGPEIGIGQYLGETITAPVMVMKLNLPGYSSLGFNLLPPDSKRYEVEGPHGTRVNAGYGDPGMSWRKGSTPTRVGRCGTRVPIAGEVYDKAIATVRGALSKLNTYYPGAKGYQVAGFFYWQGDRDLDTDYAKQYETNLVQLIKMLRRDFKAPKIPFVLATLGQTKKGDTRNKEESMVLNAQLAVDGNSGKYPEFKGNVSTVYSHPLSMGGNSMNHYNNDARTYMNVGEAMGKAMVKYLSTVRAGEWQPDKRVLLTNFNNMYQPCVVETGGDYKYKMWFFGWAAGKTNPGWPGCDATFHARSKDLKTWEVYSGEGKWDTTMNPKVWVPVLYASDRWYDSWHIGDPSVVLKDGTFYMAYSATSKHFGARAGYPSTMVQCVMGAVSDDGITWKKTDKPLLIREGDTANPRPEPDRIGDFHRPCLLWDKGKWRLWFDYWLPGKGVCMGYSENTGDFMMSGGFKIQNDLKKPLIEGWPNPDIVKIDGKYHSFSDAPGYPGKTGWPGRQLREAVSEDGINWTLKDFIAPDDDTDANHVPQAFVTTIDGTRWLYLFYATQIGRGRNDGHYHYQYDRIRAMRRRIDKGNERPSVPRQVFNLVKEKETLSLTLTMKNGVVFENVLVDQRDGKLHIPRLYGTIVCQLEDIKDFRVLVQKYGLLNSQDVRNAKKRIQMEAFFR